MSLNLTTKAISVLVNFEQLPVDVRLAVNNAQYYREQMQQRVDRLDQLLSMRTFDYTAYASLANDNGCPPEMVHKLAIKAHKMGQISRLANRIHQKVKRADVVIAKLQTEYREMIAR